MAVQAPFTTGRKVYLTSRASGKSLRIVERQVNGLGGKGKKGMCLVTNQSLLFWSSYSSLGASA